METKKTVKKDGFFSSWNWKKLRKFFGHIGLFLAVTLYTAMGALVFRELESHAEISHLNDLLKALKEKRELVASSLQCRRNYLDCGKLLTDYETALNAACKGGLSLPLNESNEITSRWSFPQSAFFASTVLTTIGYGNIVPATFWGRLFCILFAIIGIPLTVSVIADLGVLLASALSALHKKARSYFPNKKILPNLSLSAKRWLSALAGVIFLIIYLAVGAAVFMVWEEEWGFFEGFYFCFITMTTIGFGDLVPKNPNYMFICTLYILTGLALTSTIIELVRRQYAQSWKTIQALTGPLAESLRRLGEHAGTGIDVAMLQNDLKKMLTVISVPRKSQDEKEWQDAMDSVLRDIGIQPKKKPPSVLQIVIYESSV